ncbi:MAG: hypothetical protein KAH24_09280, partial [Holophagae bacterium]|nr:hypothetical protein [Holophagae bacterium]
MNALTEYWYESENCLFHLFESDDLHLSCDENAVWFRGVEYIYRNWEELHSAAIKYYESLYQFNKDKTSSYRQNASQRQSGEPDREGAGLDLLFKRPTGSSGETAKVQKVETPPETVDSFIPRKIRPGHPPVRLAGRQPEDFYRLFSIFSAVQLMGEESTPESAFNHLHNNPSLARACGFTPGSKTAPLPSRRLLQQFDQIMTENGIWTMIQLDAVRKNLLDGIVKGERNLVHDTTHHIAYSGFETVEYEDGNGKEKKKSQSHLTKSCRCEDRENCPHPWEMSDNGAGTVVKHGGKMYWAHKSSIIGLPDQGIPLIALATTDAASHDSQSLSETLEFMKTHFPELLARADCLLDDSAADSDILKKQILDDFGLEINCSVNPKRRKNIGAEDLPPWMEKLTPAGYLYCQAGHEMDFLGTRNSDGTYMYG